MIADASTLSARMMRGAMAVFAVLLVLALYPYAGDPTNVPKILLYHWFAALAMLVVLGTTWFKRESLRRPPVFFVPLLVLLGLYVVASLFSQSPAHSLIVVRQLAMLTAIYYAVSQVYRTPEQAAGWMLAFCSAVAVASLYGYAQRMGYDIFPWADTDLDEYRNMPATFGNPNFAAHTLVLSVTLAVYLAVTDKRRWYCWGFVAIYLAHLYFTRTRGASAALAAAALVALLAKAMAHGGGSPLRKTVQTVTLLIVSGCGVIAAASLGLFLATGRALPLDTSLQLRYNSYLGAARMIVDRPLLGFGPGIYEHANILFWTPFEQWWFAVRGQLNEHVHNDLLETAVDAGIVAAAVYLALLFLGLCYGLLLYFRREAPARRRFGLAAAAFFTAFMVDGLFGFNMRVPVSGFLLFVMMGFIEAMYLENAPVIRFRHGFVKQLSVRLAVLALAGVSAYMATQTFNAERYLQSGRGAMSEEHNAFAAAVTLFNRGAELAPWDFRFPLGAGYAYMQLRRHAEAEAMFERADALRPNYIPTLLALADAQRDLAVTHHAASPQRARRFLDKARNNAERVVELCLPHALGEEVLGRLAATEALLAPERAGDLWPQAEEHLTRAIDHGTPEPGRVLMMIARAQLAQDKDAEALESLQRAARFQPESREVWSVFSEYADKTGHYDIMNEALEEQIAQLAQARTPSPDAAGLLHLWRAFLLGTKLERPAEALGSYRAALDALPGRPDVWSDFALFARTHGLTGAFDQTLQAHYERHRVGVVSLPVTALAVAVARDNGPEALSRGVYILTNAVAQGRFSTEDAPVETLTGWAGRALLDEFAKHTDTMADLSGAAQALSGFFLGIEAWDAAERLLTAAMPHFPPDERAAAGQHLAALFEQQGRSREAIAALRTAVQAVPMRADLRLQLAEALESAGRTAEAKMEYLQLAQNPRLDAASRAKVEAALQRLNN